MNTEIKEINSEDIWNKFISDNPTHSFLQSWNWGKFNEKTGEIVFRFGIFKDNKLIAIFHVIKINAKRGTFLFIPHGPILTSSQDVKLETLKKLRDYLKNLAKKENCSFVRISPILKNEEDNNYIFKTLGFRKAPIHMHAELMWILDITKDEDILMKEMRKTTRHAINRAIKDGITIEKSENIEDIDKFNKIYQATVNRQHFTPFSLDYLKKEFKTFKENNEASIFFAKYQDEIVSAAIIIYQKSEAFYHHGASNQKLPKVTPSQLLQWEIIRDAKSRGCNFYNFWGISPENKKNHPWYGLSLFKKGFGGFAEELLPAQDLVINQKYWLNYIVEKVRKIKRRV